MAAATTAAAAAAAAAAADHGEADSPAGLPQLELLRRKSSGPGNGASASAKSALGTRRAASCVEGDDYRYFEATYNGDLKVMPYYGIMFTVVSNSEHDEIEVAGLELDVRADLVAEAKDGAAAAVDSLTVQVYTYEGGYRMIESDEGEWTPIADSAPLVKLSESDPDRERPTTKSSYLVPANLFERTTIPPGGIRSFYVALNEGPYLDNSVDALDKEGEVAYENSDFTILTGRGVSTTAESLFSGGDGGNGNGNGNGEGSAAAAAATATTEGSETNPKFAGKIAYRTVPASSGGGGCSDGGSKTTKTTVSYRFAIDRKESVEIFGAVSSGIDTVVDKEMNDNGEFVFWRQEYGLEKRRGAKLGVVYRGINDDDDDDLADLDLGDSDTSPCPDDSWEECTVLVGAVEFEHAARLDPGELLHQLYSLSYQVESRSRRYLDEMNVRLEYIGHVAATAQFEIVMDRGAVPAESSNDATMDAIQQRYFARQTARYLAENVYPGNVFRVEIEDQEPSGAAPAPPAGDRRRRYLLRKREDNGGDGRTLQFKKNLEKNNNNNNAEEDRGGGVNEDAVGESSAVDVDAAPDATTSSGAGDTPGSDIFGGGSKQDAAAAAGDSDPPDNDADGAADAEEVDVAPEAAGVAKLKVTGKIYGTQLAGSPDGYFVAALQKALASDSSQEQYLEAMKLGLIQPGEINEGDSYQFFEGARKFDSTVERYVDPEYSQQRGTAAPTSPDDKKSSTTDIGGSSDVQNVLNDVSEALKSVDTSTWIYVGAGVGGALLFLAALILFCCCHKKKKRAKKNEKMKDWVEERKSYDEYRLKTKDEPQEQAPDLTPPGSSSSFSVHSKKKKGRSNSIDGYTAPSAVRPEPKGIGTQRSKSDDLAGLRQPSPIPPQQMRASTPQPVQRQYEDETPDTSMPALPPATPSRDRSTRSSRSIDLDAYGTSMPQDLLLGEGSSHTRRPRSPMVNRSYHSRRSVSPALDGGSSHSRRSVSPSLDGGSSHSRRSIPPDLDGGSSHSRRLIPPALDGGSSHNQRSIAIPLDGGSTHSRSAPSDSGSSHSRRSQPTSVGTVGSSHNRRGVSNSGSSHKRRPPSPVVDTIFCADNGGSPNRSAAESRDGSMRASGSFDDGLPGSQSSQQLQQQQGKVSPRGSGRRHHSTPQRSKTFDCSRNSNNIVHVLVPNDANPENRPPTPRPNKPKPSLSKRGVSRSKSMDYPPQGSRRGGPSPTPSLGGFTEQARQGPTPNPMSGSRRVGGDPPPPKRQHQQPSLGSFMASQQPLQSGGKKAIMSSSKSVGANLAASSAGVDLYYAPKDRRAGRKPRSEHCRSIPTDAV